MPSFPLPSPLRLPWSKAAFSAPQAQSRRPIPPLSRLFDEIPVRRLVRRNLAGSFLAAGMLTGITLWRLWKKG